MNDPEFEGGVFSQTLAGGRAGARIEARHDGLHATTPDGFHFHLPYAECQLELAGASGRMWFCRTRDRALTLFSEAPGFAAALRERARRELGAELARIEQENKLRSRRTTLAWLVGLTVLGLVLFGGYLAIRQAGRASVDMLPHSVDKQIGAVAIEHMSLSGSPVDDPKLTAAVRAIVDRLAPHAGKGFQYEVRVIDGATVNAFALPGGYIVVYTGLLRAAERPEQLAGVLAHEIAHVTRRHGMRRIAQSIGLVAAVQLLFGDVSGLAAVAVELLREGAINSYSRDQEREADLEGIRTLRGAHVDPTALADFFALLAKREQALPAAIAWLGTHPDLHERITTVRREAKRTSVRPEPLPVDWSDLQRRAGKSADE
jgi:beta-barrel assembly-enhancing protease